MKVDGPYLDLINEAIASKVSGMTLPSAVRIVAYILNDLYPDSDFEELYETIFFKTNPSLSFQKSDIESILFHEERGRVKVDITVNFLGIFGAGSPLPLHYTERVYADSTQSRVLTDFLDMLNHRLKRLIFPIWRRQRLYVRHRKDLSDSYSRYMLSLLGLHPQSRYGCESLDLLRVLPYASLLGMHHLCSSSLVTILRDYFAHDEIYIEEGVVSRADLPENQRARLGEANCSLGIDLSIGEFMLTRGLKFRIVFADATPQLLEEFAPGGKRREELSELMRLTLRVPLDYEVEVRVPKERVEPACLGVAGKLGVNGWLGNVAEESSVTV